MTVWVSKRHGSAPGCYHTDEECHRVEDMENPRTWETADALPWPELEECRWCADEHDLGANDFSAYRAAVEAGREGSK